MWLYDYKGKSGVIKRCSLVSVEITISFYNFSISTRRKHRNEPECIYILYYRIDFENDVLSYVRVKQKRKDDLNTQTV